MPKNDNIPLVFGANCHDDPINRSTLRKSHNMMSHKAINTYINNDDDADADDDNANMGVASTIINDASCQYNLPCAYNYTGSVYNNFQPYSSRSRHLRNIIDDDDDDDDKGNANV